MPPYSVLTFRTRKFTALTTLLTSGSNSSGFYSRLRTTDRGTILVTRTKHDSHHLLWIKSINETHPYLECHSDT